jgi:hypothetical protein
MSSNERTGWRDEALSRRHRTWGVVCAGTDIDFLFIEYAFGIPIALVEYKECRKIKNGGVDIKDCNNLALCHLADNSKIPFLIAYYWPEIYAFRVLPVNSYARGYFYQDEKLTEREYVSRLYKMRSSVLVDNVKDKLYNALPKEDMLA